MAYFRFTMEVKFCNFDCVFSSHYRKNAPKKMLKRCDVSNKILLTHYRLHDIGENFNSAK